MHNRRVTQYVSAYSIVRAIIEDELHFPNLRELYRYLDNSTNYSYQTIIQKFKGQHAPPWFFEAIATFMEQEARKKALQVSRADYLSRITAPLENNEVERPTKSASYPDLPDHLGDGPNVTPPPKNLVEELVQFDVMVTGANYSELGRFLFLELSFRNAPFDIGDRQFQLNLTRCQLKLSLEGAMADRGEERIVEDKMEPALRIKIGTGEGIGRTRSWEIAHLETADPLLGTFVVDELCKIEQEIGPKDQAKLVAKASNVRVANADVTVENPEKQHVIEQLIRVRKLPIEHDGTILFSLQKLRR